MKRSKRILGVAVATAMLSLAACSSGEGGGGEAPTSLTVSTWTATEPGLKDWWPELAAGFEAEHGVSIDVQQVAFADYQQQLTTQLTAGSAPDVIHVPTPTTMLPAWAEAGFLADLDDFLASTDIAEQWPDTQAVMGWDGTTYGVLLVDYGYVLFVNEAILAEAGVAVPTTPEELLAAAEAVEALDGDRKAFAVVADNSPNLIRDALVFAAGVGAEWATPGEWHLTDPDVVEAIDLWRTLAQDHSPAGSDIAQKREAYITGNVAMMIEGPFYQATVKANAEASIVDSLALAPAPFPTNPGDVSHGLSIPAGQDEATMDLALAFVEYASSDEMMQRYSELVTSPVARPGSADGLLDSPDTAVIAEAAEDKAPIVDPALEGLRADYFDFTEVASATFLNMLTSSTPTEELMADLQSNLEGAGITP